MFIYLFNLFISAVPGLSCNMRDLLVAACRLLVAACMQDLVPWPGIEPRPPALGAWSLTHKTTKEVPSVLFQSTLTEDLDLPLCLHPFPIAAATNYHKRNDLKWHKCILL